MNDVTNICGRGYLFYTKRTRPMNTIIYLLLLLEVSISFIQSFDIAPETILDDVKKHWEYYKNAYELKVLQKDDERFMNTFKNNTIFVMEHNARNSLHKCKLNQFSHMTTEEFRTCKGMMPFKVGEEAKKRYGTVRDDIPLKNKDWRKDGLVSPVKNQGQCGSCWAFSATGAMEFYYTKKYKEKKLLSEQDLVDCSGKFNNQGCNGGFYTRAFEYVEENGINSAKSYPYIERDGKCTHSPLNNVLKVSSYVDLPFQNETALSYTISNVGVVSVAIDASHPSLQFYHSGIYIEPACSSTNLDHAVLVVGIGGSGQDLYYIVKNSWGDKWGENGYFRLVRGRNNMCGIATYPAYPDVTKLTKADL